MNARRFLSLVLSGILLFSALGGAGGAILLKTDAASVTYTEEALETVISGEDHGDCDCAFGANDALGLHNGDFLTPVLEKNRYADKEQILLRVEALSAAAGKEVSYTSVGFSIVNDAVNTFSDDTGAQGYQLLLVHDGVTEAPCFSLEVVTDTGLTVSAKVFGYLAEDALFVSKSSYDAAKEASYYHLVEIGRITMEAFNALLQREYSLVGVESTEMTEGWMVSCDAQDGTAESFATSGTTQIGGTLVWKDDNDVSHPMQHNTVEVWDELTAKKLGTVYTGVDGKYTFTISTSTTYNVYIKVYPGGENSIVKTGYKGEYVYKSSTQTNVTPGSVVNINWTVDMSSDLGRAIQVSQAINVATKYVKQMRGAYISAITVYYPHVESNSGCFYNGSIYICSSSATGGRPESYASWDVVMHEYGHHVQSKLGITQSPGGSHSFTQNLADSRSSKDLGIRLAWGESYPSVFGAMAQMYYISSLQNIVTVGDAQYTSYNGAYLNYETTTTCKGEACEASVIAVLWDLFDNTTSESHDKISFSHENYWRMMIGSGAKTFSAFCNYFNRNYSSAQAVMLGSLLSYYKMSVSGLWVNSAAGLPTISWTANGTSSSLTNNKFDLIVFDKNYNELFRVQGITSTSYTITTNDKVNMQNGECGIRYAVIVAYQTSSPSTGGYYSTPIEIGEGHNYGEWSIFREPTCTKQGQERQTCNGCAAYQARAVDALGHDHKVVSTVAPQCEERGYSITKCERCEETGQSNFVAALGHNHKVISTVAPQCEAQGYSITKCERCEETGQSNFVAALGHNHKVVSVVAPQCEAQGYSITKCERCEETGQSNFVAALGHNHKVVSVVAPQCEAQGYSVTKCERCDDQAQSNFVAALGHTRKIVLTVEPQCEAVGYSICECERCGDQQKSNFVVETGHLTSSWEIARYPSKREQGEEQRCCQTCGAQLETRALEPYTHLISFETKVKALTGDCNRTSYEDLIARLNYYEMLEPQYKEAVHEDYERLCEMIERYNDNASARNNATVQESVYEDYDRLYEMIKQSIASESEHNADGTETGSLAHTGQVLDGLWYSFGEKSRKRG